MRRKFGNRAKNNNFLQITYIYRDIPLDILHNRYLGEVKILLKKTLDIATDHNKNLLRICIEDLSSKTMINATSIIKYTDSLHGKDFKHFVKHAPFIFERSGMDRKVVELWFKISEANEIVGRDELSEGSIARLMDIQIAITNMAFNLFSSTIKTQKIHQNLHTTMFIERHGAPNGYNTEAGESWCGLIKNCQFSTNFKAPSRDTALHFCRFEKVRHILDGGNWKIDDKLVRSSSAVQCPGDNVIVKKYLFGKSMDDDIVLPVFQRPDRINGNIVKQKIENVNVCFYRELKCDDSLTKGDFFAYREDYEIKIAEFLFGIKKDDAKDVAVANKFILQNGLTLGCQKGQKTSIEVNIPVENIVQYIFLVHDCNGGNVG